MEILDQLYTIAVIEPAYNVFIWLFSTVGQHSVGLTTIVLGVLAAAFFLLPGVLLVGLMAESPDLCCGD